MDDLGKAFPIYVGLASLLAPYLRDLWLQRQEMAVRETSNWRKQSISRRTGLPSDTVLAGWSNELTTLMKVIPAKAKSWTCFGVTWCNCRARDWLRSSFAGRVIRSWWKS